MSHPAKARHGRRSDARCGLARMRTGVRFASSMALALALAAGVTAVHERDAIGQAGLRRPPWLGVELEPARGEGRGVRVRHAIRSSPGWNAGLRDGDLILRIEDVATSRPDDVIREVSARAPGTVGRLPLIPAGTEMSVTAPLADLPEGGQILRPGKIAAPAPRWQGLCAGPCNPARPRWAPAPALLAVLAALLWALRGEGFEISPPQAIEVGRVGREGWFDAKRGLCEAMACVVVGSMELRARYDQVFDEF